MSVPQDKVPVIQSIKAAFAGWRGGLVASLPVAGLAAAVAGGFGILTGAANSPMSFLGQVIVGALVAVFFATVIRPAVGKPHGLSAGAVADGVRVFSAMAVVGFFLLIVVVVAMIPGIALLGAALSPFMEQIEAAQGDQAATMAIVQQALTANPAAFFLIALIYGFVWMALTSRLYLAAPASVAHNRVMSFDTWNWTKGNMLRIMAARLLLLVPAWLAATLIAGAIAQALGVNAGADGAITAGSPMVIAFVLACNTFILTVVYSGLEARLAAYLHEGLRPQA